MNIIKLENTPSTNQYLKDHSNELTHFDVVYTKRQTNGRGRQLNQWFSNENSLTFSMILKDSLNKDIIQIMPFYSAYVLRELLKQFSDDIKIKWPNDILINNKKVGGILVESMIQGDHINLIVGIGININQDEFPESINEMAISLKQVTQYKLEPFVLLKDIVRRFIDHFNQTKEQSQRIINYCKDHLAYKNQMITFTSQNKSLIGKCLSMNKKGHLIIDIDGVKQDFVSGEVQYIRQYKTKKC